MNQKYLIDNVKRWTKVYLFWWNAHLHCGALHIKRFVNWLAHLYARLDTQLNGFSRKRFDCFSLILFINSLFLRSVITERPFPIDWKKTKPLFGVLMAFHRYMQWQWALMCAVDNIKNQNKNNKCIILYSVSSFGGFCLLCFVFFVKVTHCHTIFILFIPLLHFVLRILINNDNRLQYKWKSMKNERMK